MPSPTVLRFSAALEMVTDYPRSFTRLESAAWFSHDEK